LKPIKFTISCLAILAASFLMLGCGNSDDFVFTNTNNNIQTGNRLEVSANQAALARNDVRLQFSDVVTDVRVTVYDTGLAEVGQQTVAVTDTAVFVGLANGDYLVRMEGLDNGGNVVGYFDIVVTVSSALTQATVPGLINNPTPPAPAFPAPGGGPAFFLFTSSPQTAQGATPFSVTLQAYDAEGNPAASVVTGVTLLSNGIAFEVDPAAQDTSAAGLLTITGLSFALDATGTTTFTASATGLPDAVSFTTTVSAPPDFFASTQQASVAIGGGEPNDSSDSVSTSADGRLVAFESDASDLVAGDDEGFSDVFVYDRDAGTTERISQAANGDGGNNSSDSPQISDDGRYVVFESSATNLGPTDSNSRTDVYIYDRQTSTMELVSVATNGDQGADMSRNPTVSADGNLIAFTSESDFVNGGDTSTDQVWLRNRSAGTTSLVSKASNGDPGNLDSAHQPLITGNGQFIVYPSAASNIVTPDTNGRDSVMVYDVAGDSTIIASRNANGDQADFGGRQSAISEDGRYVSFTSAATNLVTGGVNQTNVYLKDLQTGAVTWISQSNGGGMANAESYDPRISGDGRFVVFYGDATDFIAGDTGTECTVWVYDHLATALAKASVASDGGNIDAFADYPNISRDGSVIGFNSQATNLISGFTPPGNNDIVYVTSNPFRR
jgi:hypothetical protein